MKFQTKALDVLETTSHFLKSGAVESTPAWYTVVGANPPFKNQIKVPTFNYQKVAKEQESFLDTDKESKAKKSTKRFQYNANTGFYKTRITKGNSVETDVYKPIKLKFLQDELRNLFYYQHPWELADGKILVEGNSVVDYEKLDWSSIIQLNKKLDGESVVQRTLYILKDNKKQVKQNPSIEKISLEKAYNQARFEYYQIKMAREAEVQVAQEEATFSGAVFKPSSIEVGFEKESQVLSKWKEDALAETKRIEALRSGNSAGPEAGESEGALDDVFDDIPEAQEESK
ncbi:mitochondrial 37S ribosomal protein [Saccharomycopsis crataegensis]|uniref:37S ribosomal protein S25, mitochondrial n=1 Tax=Saccharomycopsis crataegensis TaxID=43959 RepID=A0AAV5QTR3_9ASCO|nr:mitochondrial 37S ribosomal protein [Saccharomycopsis crataegensis]